MSDIFISYAIEDLDRIKPLVKALEEVGWSVWWDRSMLPGSRWQRVLRDAIGAAKCVMVAWSETSITSEWVEIEAEEGRRRGILVPVLIDDVVPPFPFGGIQGARLVGWSGLITDAEFGNLMRAVGQVAPRSAGLGQYGRAAEIEELRRQREEAEASAEERHQGSNGDAEEAKVRRENSPWASLLAQTIAQVAGSSEKKRAEVIDISGVWTSRDGFTYEFSQSGVDVSMEVKNTECVVLTNGNGRIEGNQVKLSYRTLTPIGVRSGIALVEVSSDERSMIGRYHLDTGDTGVIAVHR